jgi:hypothetical protein
LNQSHLDNLECAGETPSYYAVIPASVLYDQRLSADAKLLYAEISGLCRLKGFCWASNAYFAKIHDVCGRTILRWINDLQDAGHIFIKLEYEPDSKEISRRLIYLSQAVKQVVTNLSPPRNNTHPDAVQDAVQSSQVVTDLSPPRNGEHDTRQGGDNFVVGVVTNLSGGGDKNVAGTNKTTNIKKATAAASGTEEQEKPEAAAAVPLTPNEVKDACIKIDGSLIFDRDFYEKASAYMHGLGLDLPFLAWVYQYCARKRPNSLRDYYFKVFFLESLAEAFSESIKPPAAARETKCPVCGTVYSGPNCPQCGIYTDAGKEEIELAVKLHSMPEDRRREYEKLRTEIGAQLSENNDFVVFHDGMIKLKRQFGLDDA